LEANVFIGSNGEALREFGVYLIFCSKNQRIYIGSTTTNFRERWGEHRNNLRKNKHVNQHLQFAWNKYGEEYFYFYVLEIVNNKDGVLSVEQAYINVVNNENSFNMCKIAGNTTGRKSSEESVLKKSKKWVFVTPENEIIYVVNMRKFCRESGIPQSQMINVAHRNTNHYKKWLAYKEEEFSLELLKCDRERMKKTEYILTNSDGEEFIVTNMAEFAKINNLNASCLINVIKGDHGRTQHKGWKIRYK